MSKYAFISETNKEDMFSLFSAWIRENEILAPNSYYKYRIYIKDTYTIFENYLNEKGNFYNIHIDTYKQFSEKAKNLKNYSYPLLVGEYILRRVEKEGVPGIDYSKVKISKISNCISAFRLFAEFMNEEGYCFDVEISKLPDCIKEYELNYSYNQIQKIFKSRLITQDRIYKNEGMVFPIRLLSKLFNGKELAKALDNKQIKEDYAEIIRDRVDSIQFIVSSDGNDIVFFSDLNLKKNKLKVKKRKNNQWVVAGNKSFGEKIIYTKIYKDASKKKNKGDFIPLVGADFSSLSIDHDDPQKMLFTQNLNDYPSFVKLNEIIVSQNGGVLPDQKILKSKDFSKKVIDTIITEYKDLPQSLLLELKGILEKTNYVIMEKGENSAKSDKV